MVDLVGLQRSRRQILGLVGGAAVLGAAPHLASAQGSDLHVIALVIPREISAALRWNYAQPAQSSRLDGPTHFVYYEERPHFFNRKKNASNRRAHLSFLHGSVSFDE